MKQNILFFILTQKQKQLLMKVILMTYLNKVRLYQTPKNIMENVPVELLIQL